MSHLNRYALLVFITSTVASLTIMLSAMLGESILVREWTLSQLLVMVALATVAFAGLVAAPRVLSFNLGLWGGIGFAYTAVAAWASYRHGWDFFASILIMYRHLIVVTMFVGACSIPFLIHTAVLKFGKR